MLQEAKTRLFLACGLSRFYHDYYSWMKTWRKAYLSIHILQTVLLTDGDQLLSVQVTITGDPQVFTNLL